MTIRYNGEILNVELGTPIRECARHNIPAIMPINKGGWNFILLLGGSGSGKSGHAKDIAVKLSKTRKVCIFSLKGEWERHVTHYSTCPFSDYKQKMVGVKVIENYPIRLSDIESRNDFLSIGFTWEGASILFRLLRDGKEYHGYDLDRFLKMIYALPTKEYQKSGDEWVNLLVKYEDEFEMTLYMPLNHSIKQSIVTRFEDVRHWFHQGNKERRKEVDFVKEWLNNDHLIINVTESERLEDGTVKQKIDRYKARFVCGIFLKKISPYHKRTKGFFIFEEGRYLFPKIEQKDALLPSSIVAIYDIMTTGRKEGVGCMVISQSPDQIFQDSFPHFYSTIVLGHCDDYALSHGLKWNPNANMGHGYREGVIINKNNTYCKYIPAWSCCKV